MDISQISNQLSSFPQAFTGCCLTGISSTFISYLASLLPKKPGFTVSVGSGSGLLEALVAHHHSDIISVEGVEVNSSVNRYLPAEKLNLVGGTWDLHSRVSQAKAWMFVYPREPKLIKKYIDTYGHHHHQGAVEIILWVGPRVDWADYEPCFRNSAFSKLSFPEEIGLTPYEILVVAKKDVRGG